MHNYIPEPLIIMVGCRAWTNLPHRRGHCPACGGGVRPEDSTRYCAVCDSLAPKVEARVRAARIGTRRRERSEEAVKQVTRSLRRSGEIGESERRRMWHGYKRVEINCRTEDVPNIAHVYRKFLLSIGQPPRWNLTLDRRGRVTGRTCELPPET